MDVPDNSFDAGYLDGELAAITGLTSRRAHARIAMAETYDRLYAQGYSDGYLNATAVNNVLRQTTGDTR
ncbi:hypothetical protein AB0B07_33385 [Streptomyces sioyaensis]|uniref:hypothetical protein n=1 Tax=Streptomyces sioyaensis TaxID=67364 RepID=UPI0033C124FB